MPSTDLAQRRLARPALSTAARRFWLGGLCAAAIALQGCDAYLFQAFNSDKVTQAAAGQSWLDGLRYSIPIASTDGTVSREPVIQWPPGYSLAYAAALSTTGDPFRATYTIDLLSAALFFLSWRRILLIVESAIAFRAQLLFWAFCAAVFSPIARLPSSDTLAIAFESVSLALALSAWTGRAGAWAYAAAGLAAGGAAAVRFAYWPLVPVPILALALDRERPRWRDAIAFAAAAAVPMGWAASVNVMASGRLTNIAADDDTLYWRQLFTMRPFGASLLGIDAAWTRGAALVPAIGAWLPAVFWAVTLIIAVIAIRAVRRAMAEASGSFRALALAGLLTVGLTFALVCAFTVRVAADAGGWTYATDAARYMAPAYPFLLLALAVSAAESSRFVRIAALALLILAAATVTPFRMGQLTAYAAHPDRHASGWSTRRDLTDVFEAVRRERGTGAEVIYCDANLVRQAFASMAGAAAPPACTDPQRRSTTARVIGPR